MKRVGLFDAKTRFSQICKGVARDRKPVIVTCRGSALVVIQPINEEKIASNVWELREMFESEKGKIEVDLAIPPRRAEPFKKRF